MAQAIRRRPRLGCESGGETMSTYDCICGCDNCARLKYGLAKQVTDLLAALESAPVEHKLLSLNPTHEDVIAANRWSNAYTNWRLEIRTAAHAKAGKP